MEIYKGKKGLKQTWQEDFPETTPCKDSKCKGIARIAFVACENKEKEYICNLYNKKKELWVHDACAVAVYFCIKCLEPIAILNQA